MMIEYKTPSDRLGFEMAGQSPGCLLLHGFTGDPREMRLLADALSNQLGLYVYVPLLPGHGGPPHLMQGLSIGDFSEAVNDALAKVREQHSRVIVCAYSMGAALAAPIVAEHPVAGFVALAPMLVIRNPLLPLAPLARHLLPWIYPLKLANIDVLGLRDELLAYDPTLNLDDPATLAMLRNEVRFPVSVADELRKMQIQARKAAAKISAPTLILQGSLDLTLNPAGAQRFFDQLAAPDKQIRFFPGVDHDIVKARNPANREMIAAVLAWIKERF